MWYSFLNEAHGPPPPQPGLQRAKSRAVSVNQAGSETRSVGQMGDTGLGQDGVDAPGLETVPVSCNAKQAEGLSHKRLGG